MSTNEIPCRCSPAFRAGVASRGATDAHEIGCPRAPRGTGGGLSAVSPFSGAAQPVQGIRLNPRS